MALDERFDALEPELIDAGAGMASVLFFVFHRIECHRLDSELHSGGGPIHAIKAEIGPAQHIPNMTAAGRVLNSGQSLAA